ncbi:nuclear transport factor 2 family protein [Costertonia aggregata]|uniref:Nuclear transport factor 2 family protein n=1 Tax=Costertonia aggregata TaxID=343403 RepID=A0A7H9AJK2_9FLAO|nr:nuclear transport factor 2 family protein [Costertonia aggregata]QLG43798.1 nuclear transport factor 2 family protein [Costertonia aggregata]
MKLYITCTLFFVLGGISAQTSEEKLIQETIETFFDGFHGQDSITIKKTVHNEMILQTLGKDHNGETEVKTEDFSKFIASIANIPDSIKFKENIKSFSIQIDGDMANVWAPYEFWLNGQLHHCGVNSFQLIRRNGKWKIIYLIDTRRKEGCQ